MKNKYYILILFFLCLIIGLSFFLYVFKDKEDFNIQSTEYSKDIYNTDDIEESFTNEMLNIAYYESDDEAYFSSIPLNTDISWYNVYWYLMSRDSLMKNNDFEELSTENIELLLPEGEIDTIYDFYYKVNCEYFIFESIDKSNYSFNNTSIDVLINDCTFFNENDDLKENDVYNAYLLIDTLSKYDYQLLNNYKSIVLNKVEEYLDSDYDKQDSYDYNHIIKLKQILILLDTTNVQSYAKCNILLNDDNYIHWLKNIKYRDLVEVIRNIDEDSYFNNTNKIDVISKELYKDILFMNLSSTYNESNDGMEPQLLFLYITVKLEYCPLNNEGYNEIYDILEFQDVTLYKRNTTFVPSLFDTYYGILISDIIDYKFNKEKIENFNISNKNLMLSAISNGDVNIYIMELYYSVAISNYFDSEIYLDKDKILLYNILNDYIESINELEDNSSNILVTNVRFALEILIMLEVDLDTSLKEVIIQYIEQCLTDSILNETIYITEVFLIAKLIDYDILNFNNNLSVFYYEGAFRYSKEIPYPDIISTAKIIRVNDISKYKEEVSKYIVDLYNEDSCFCIHFGDDDIQLRVIYYYYLIISKL